MKIQDLHIGMRVKHPSYGEGVVRNISEHTADVFFEDGKRIVEPEAAGLEAAETQAAVTGLQMPLQTMVRQIVAATVAELGLEKPNTLIDKLAARWHGGKIVMHPADPSLQTKDVPVEVFFHKIVMMRNNFRTLEQKINAHPTLNDSEKVELQQYITRCYGSMTTFNLLFRDREDYFSGSGKE
ncbi:MAG TPA: hypothetical protein VEH27_10780 [Methylomirabilota bacterium]|nr:hypothetical protein [Methylomirabilota bacterium]